MTHATLRELSESVHGLSPAPDHVASCADCLATEARLRGELDLLRRADARLEPHEIRRRRGSLVSLALVAAALLSLTALVVLRTGPGALPGSRTRQEGTDLSRTIDAFLNGKEEESARARQRLVERSADALGALVDARFNRPPSIRPDALAALILELKEKRAGERGAAIFASIKKARITADMQNAPLSAVADYIREISAVTLYIDPALKPDEFVINLKVADLPLHRAFDLLGFATPIEYDVRYGVLFLGTPERLFGTPKAAATLPSAAHFRRQELDDAGKATLKKLDSLSTDLAFEGTVLSDLVFFLRDFSGLNILTQDGIGNEPVTIRTKNLPLGSVLELLALPRGLDVRIEGGALLLFKPKK